MFSFFKYRVTLMWGLPFGEGWQEKAKQSKIKICFAPIFLEVAQAVCAACFDFAYCALPSDLRL